MTRMALTGTAFLVRTIFLVRVVLVCCPKSEQAPILSD